MKKLIVSLLFVTMFVSCQQQNYDEQKQRCINFIEKGEKFTQVAASARYNIWSEKLNPALNDEKKQKEMEDVYAQNSQEAKHYLDSINTETKSLKDIDADWYNDIILLRASLEEHYNLLNTESTSLEHYWGKHKILQSEIDNNIASFKQKYLKNL
jgi:hypothetical protein